MFALVLILFLVVMASPAHADEWVYGPDKDGDAVVLTEKPCTLDHPDAGMLRGATLVNVRGTFSGCWIMGPNGIGIIWEPAANDAGWRINPALFRKAIDT